MSIEAVPHASVQISSDTPRGGQKTRAAEATSGSLPGDFQSLLSGLDEVADIRVPGAAGLAEPDAAVADDPLATPPNRKKSGLAKPHVDATTVDPAALAASVPMTPTANPVISATVDPAASLPLAEVATPSEAAADALSASNGPAQMVGADVQESPLNRANYASVFEQMQSRLAVDTASDSVPQPISALKESQRKAGIAGAAAEMRADRASSVAAASAWSLPVTAPSASQSLAGMAEELQAAVREKTPSTGTVDAKLPEGAVQHYFTPTVQFEVANATLGSSPASPEAAVAEQVNYWIAQGIQNAELTLDGAGSQPVEVSISLSGNTAHVEFRTDQLETRELLSGAATHLKDLLQQEGMVLSGLSVGSSGAGGAGPRERRGSAEVRQSAAGTSKVDAVGGTAVPMRASSPFGPSGRTVDYFV